MAMDEKEGSIRLTITRFAKVQTTISILVTGIPDSITTISASPESSAAYEFLVLRRKPKLSTLPWSKTFNESAHGRASTGPVLQKEP